MEESEMTPKASSTSVFLSGYATNRFDKRRFRYVAVEQPGSDFVGLGIVGLDGRDSPFKKREAKHIIQRAQWSSHGSESTPKPLSSSTVPSLASPFLLSTNSPSLMSPALLSQQLLSPNSPTMSPLPIYAIDSALASPMTEQSGHLAPAALVTLLFGALTLLSGIGFIFFRFFRKRRIPQSGTISSFGESDKSIDSCEKDRSILREIVVEQPEASADAVMFQRLPSFETLSSMADTISTPPDGHSLLGGWSMPPVLTLFDEEDIASAPLLPILEEMLQEKCPLEASRPVEVLRPVSVVIDVPTSPVELPAVPVVGQTLVAIDISSQEIQEESLISTEEVEEVKEGEMDSAEQEKTLEVPTDTESERLPSFLRLSLTPRAPLLPLSKPKRKRRIEPAPFIPEIIIHSASLSSLASTFSNQSIIWQGDIFSNESILATELPEKPLPLPKKTPRKRGPSRIPRYTAARSAPINQKRVFEQKHQRHRRSQSLGFATLISSSMKDIGMLLDEDVPRLAA